MTDTPPLVPEGIGHEPDGQASPSPVTIADHTRKLRSIALYQGLDGVKAYKAAHPEAAACRIHAAPVAYVPKPAGYTAELGNIVAHWFDSEAALAQSNKADVARLNGKLGTAFNVGNHFSKPLSPSALKRISTAFAQRGAVLDPSRVRTMSDVRKAVRTAKATGGCASVPLGAWGTRDGDRLIVGKATFAIERHNGNDCIRIPVEGSRVRLRLDALGEFMSSAGIKAPSEPESISNHLPRSGIGDMAPDPEMHLSKLPDESPLPENWPQTDMPQTALHTGELAPDASQLSLAERIQRLRPISGSPARTDGMDPLALP